MTDDEREAAVVQRLAKVRQDTVAALAMFRVAATLGEDTDAYRDTVYEPLLTLSQHDVVRLVVGPNARLVIPLSAIYGAALLATADIIARTLGEIPVGVVTAVIGAPFFLYILRRTRTGYEL